MESLEIEGSIVDFIDSDPRFCADNKRAPYIRLCCVGAALMETILKGMIEAGITEDVELKKLDGFISASEFEKGKGLDAFWKTPAGKLLEMQRNG